MSKILLLILLISPSSAWAKTIRLMWEGIESAQYYELQLANSPDFKEVKAIPVKKSNIAFELPDEIQIERINGRIRAVFGEKNFSRWQKLEYAVWPAVPLPKRYRIKRDEIGVKEIKWPHPANAQDGDLTYRVQIISFKERTVLYDVFTLKNSFVIPKLPGGDFYITVETVGHLKKGTLHLEATNIAVTLIETDAVSEAALAEEEKELARNLVTMTDLFFKGVSLGSNVNYSMNSYQQKLWLEEEIRGSSKKFGVTVTVPIVVSETTKAEVISSSPRFGGNPYPKISAQYKITGDHHSFFAAGVSSEVGFDSSAVPASTPGNAYGLFGAGRMSNPQWLADYRLSIEATTKGARLGLSVEPTFALSSRMRAGVNLGVLKLPVLGAQITFMPLARYQLLDWAYLQSGLGLTTKVTPQSAIRVFAGFVMVF